MQAVILAAGRGTRMGELTAVLPKPMLEIGGKTLLEHKFETLPKNVDEVILVVGYLGSVIHDRFGGIWRDKRLLYVEQEKIDGTAGALWQAKGILRDRFLVMNGDNLYARGDMAACAAQEDWAVLVEKRDDVRTGRVVAKDGFVTGIVENTEHTGAKGYANAGLYALDTRIFDYPQLPKAKGSPELGLPQTMMQAVGEIPIRAIEATFWFEIKAPGDLKRAEEILHERA